MKRLCCLPLLLLTSVSASAEQIQFKIVDVLWLTHSSRGEGVEIVYQFARKPDDGDDALKAFALSECNRVAPKYVPLVLKQVGKTEADFVSMNLRFGGAFGTYIKFFAENENGVCSDMD